MVSIASHSDRRPVCRRGVRVCWAENVQSGNEDRAFDFAGGLIRFFRVRLCPRFLPTERRSIARGGIGFETNHTGKCAGGRRRYWCPNVFVLPRTQRLAFFGEEWDLRWRAERQRAGDCRPRSVETARRGLPWVHFKYSMVARLLRGIRTVCSEDINSRGSDVRV